MRAKEVAYLGVMGRKTYLVTVGYAIIECLLYMPGPV